MQGIFVEYGITVDDDATEIRNGGFGSTTAKYYSKEKAERKVKISDSSLCSTFFTFWH